MPMSPAPTASRTPVVLALGVAQTLAWASSFYLPAMLAAPMARELGVAVPTVYALLSMALVVAALLGPLAGRLIDRHGGRPVLMACSGLFALGLAVLATAQGPLTLVLAWAVLGVAMGFGPTTPPSRRWCACTAPRRAPASPASRCWPVSPAPWAGP